MSRQLPCGAHADWLSSRWAGRGPGQPFTNFRAVLPPLKGQRRDQRAAIEGLPRTPAFAFYSKLCRFPAQKACPGAAQPGQGTGISGFWGQWELLGGLFFIWKGQIGAGWKRESVDSQSSPSCPPCRVGIMEEKASLGVWKGPSGHIRAAWGSPTAGQSGTERS